MLLDTHSHLFMDQFDSDRDEVIKRALNVGVELFIDVAFDLEYAEKIVSNTNHREKFYYSVGTHPHHAEQVLQDNYLQRLELLAKKDRVVAIGEIGLDYFRNLKPKDVQILAFKKQLELSFKLDMPVIIHSRDAQDDMLEVLKSYVQTNKLKGIVHSFLGDEELVNKYLELGFIIGIGGPITYPKNDILRETIKNIPLDRLVLETDCPYLPPQKYRGQRNEPANIRIIAEKLQEIKNENIETIEKTTTKNVLNLFKIHNRSII